jgi:hypothetical protein
MGGLALPPKGLIFKENACFRLLGAAGHAVAAHFCCAHGSFQNGKGRVKAHRHISRTKDRPVTRKTLNRNLLTFSIALSVVLLVAFAAKVSGNKLLIDVYGYLHEMSVLLLTVFVPYLAHLFQRRSSFLQSLREEWREIVQAKSVLMAYCDRDDPSLDEYLEAYYEISQCIDYMRIVYSNVGRQTS